MALNGTPILGQAVRAFRAAGEAAKQLGDAAVGSSDDRRAARRGDVDRFVAVADAPFGEGVAQGSGRDAFDRHDERSQAGDLRRKIGAPRGRHRAEREACQERAAARRALPQAGRRGDRPHSRTSTAKPALASVARRCASQLARWTQPLVSARPSRSGLGVP